MRRYGIETEYGFLVEGHGAADQVELARDAVRLAPGFADRWDYSREHPRRDLRGFSVEALQVDPTDWKFEEGSRARQSSADTRADRVLSSGARFYNDHGHPEFATRECATLAELVAQDRAGEEFVRQVCALYAQQSGRRVEVYKNNTDFHGASYGTHENYLAPRHLGFDGLAPVLIPMLIARTVLCGAGKVGREAGPECDFQLSARADFFSETASVDTLFKRPLMNTRDEPHAPENDWIRVHVITGDANMMPGCTARKVALAQLALDLAAQGWKPPRLENPVAAFQQVSREECFRLADGSFETADGLLWRYLDAAGEAPIAHHCRRLLDLLAEDWRLAAPEIDWAAKRFLIEHAGTDSLAEQRSLDLAYHSLDPETSLYAGLEGSGWVANPALPNEPKVITRGQVRGHFVSQFAEAVEAVTWSAIRLRGGRTIELRIETDYPASILATSDVESCISLTEQAHGNSS
ncbi:MAG: proteasome accessory factor PafA2 family protein [Chthonomonas sp.]|nr:proteasome accessory factor PafA2 family protein [Chthonomonas sp.]